MLSLLFISIFRIFSGDPTFTVENRLTIPREEVVSISLEQIEKILGEPIDPKYLEIQQLPSKTPVLTQWTDIDQDGNYDEVLFFVTLEKNEKKNYQISIKNEEVSHAQPELKTFGRFVPERIDDFAWENDKVAFRTYGPEAQRLTDEGLPGGTLTSGIDAWLKRVEYPIIDKWYKLYTEGGSYHTDSGEGYDPYHVGDSRGIGGIGVWMDDSLHVSKNFVKYKILANGPLRTVFELTYDTWVAGSNKIEETKRISLDLGSNLYRMEVFISHPELLPNVTTGITLHDKKGEINSDVKAGWISYWETIDDSKLGTGIVMDPKHIIEKLEVKTNSKDQSHIYLLMNPKEKINYYAGFGWEKAGEFSSSDEWNQYLENFAAQLASPLIIRFN